MIPLLARRLAGAAALLFVVSLAAFFVVRLVPGDTVTAMLGPGYNEAQARELRQRHGLDRPLPVQYGLWLSRAARGDLGTSIRTEEPVARRLARRIPVTLELAALSLVFAVAVGLPLGVAAALHRGGGVDAAASVAGLLGVSVPGFWLGTLCILLFSLTLGWLPPGGYVPVAQGVGDHLRSMVLPTVALGSVVAAVILRMTRASLLEVLGEDYLRAARARGLPGRVVVWRHGLRCAVAPVLTAGGIQAGYLLGGSVVIEQVFALPGVGTLALSAIGGRDYPLLQGVILFISGAFVLVNLAVDLLHATADPRTRGA